MERIKGLFTIKTKFEGFLVIYALALGATERGVVYMHQYPGVGGQLLGGPDEVGPPPPTAVPSTTVATVATTPPPFWMNKYDWSLKDHVDALAADVDCAALHDRYVKATLANGAVAERYGTGTADLLEYIFIVSEAIGCYGE